MFYLFGTKYDDGETNEWEGGFNDCFSKCRSLILALGEAENYIRDSQPHMCPVVQIVDVVKGRRFDFNRVSIENGITQDTIKWKPVDSISERK
jgi:hypothetical protein